ncbi:FMN-binding negative transcriptional regulator [Flavobacterium humi]|uniref:FMN-binding negative transcriptional regulator n=1 Tax=Flavobacterium humi TaxID=2562683 RepID=A0A4Z0L6U5_9FLAO|nr:FMN-binding negative transcriptional regulator [Flavobacterium humi]TGD57971.1 FMN-binding negative transcriptional regulator [Flavobacterium humi]
MYIPEIYKNENREEIQHFIHENGFAILINQTDGRPCATHIPLILDQNPNGRDILVGHISKENPQGKSLAANTEVLAVFSGPHSYISSSWYDHENVPTWNYLAVHAYGKISILTPEETILSLKKLVDKYEKNSEKPIRVEDLSAKTMMQARGIIAFEIEITSLEAIKKLSQNRDAKNYQNIIAKLENSDDHNAKQIALEMKKNK